MQINDLSAAEVALIRQHREKTAECEAAMIFQRKAIATAHAFINWSTVTNEGLTFSTFINTFGYQEADNKEMFEAVQRILNVALPRLC